jgi:hypothetical protein
MWQLNETTNIIRTDLIDNDQCIALSRAVNSSHWANRRKPWMRESERRRPPKPGLEGNVQLDLHSSLPLSPAEDVDVLTRGSGLITWRRRAFLNSPALRSVIGFPRCDYRGDLYEPFRLRIRHRKIHQLQSTVFLREIQLASHSPRAMFVVRVSPQCWRGVSAAPVPIAPDLRTELLDRYPEGTSWEMHPFSGRVCGRVCRCNTYRRKRALNIELPFGSAQGNSPRSKAVAQELGVRTNGS